MNTQGTTLVVNVFLLSIR